ncbi:unnamed protein product [Closterium sp. Yama58-4]|nr:unnamed protein product [Closterium sp. Yama58-4]
MHLICWPGSRSRFRLSFTPESDRRFCHLLQMSLRHAPGTFKAFGASRPTTPSSASCNGTGGSSAAVACSRSKINFAVGSWLLFLRGFVLLLVLLAVVVGIGLYNPLGRGFSLAPCSNAWSLKAHRSLRDMAVPQVAAASEGDEAAADNDVNTADDSLPSDLDSNSMAATRLSFKSSRVRAAAEAAAAVNVAFGRRLRVYVYDLPREFNYGMVELFSRNRNIAIPDGVDPPPGEWWLLRDLLKPEHERRNSPAVRVTDPADADVFFVPVFSSLSLVVNPLGLVRNYQLRADAWDDKAMQERLMDWLELQEPWRRSRGRDHVIPAQVRAPVVPCAQRLVIWLPLFNVPFSTRAAPHFPRSTPVPHFRGSIPSLRTSLPFPPLFHAPPPTITLRHRWQDPNSLFTVLTRLRRAMLLVSDFGRVAAWQANLMKDVVVPYVHRVSTYSPKDEDDDRRRGVYGNRTTLLFFMGNRYRKDGGAVRDALFKSLEQEKDMILREGTPTVEGRRATRAGMRTSQFCLHPAGDTPSACRMFDAIVNLCVPVVVSDDIELPFEDVLDYREFAVFVPTVKAVRKGYLGKLLRSRKMQSRLPAMQQRLREVRHFFEWDAEDGTVNQVWRRVAAKLPAIREMIHRERRMVRGGLSNCSMVCTARSVNSHKASTGSTSPGGSEKSTGSSNGSEAMASVSAPAVSLPAATLSTPSAPSSGDAVGSASASTPSVSASSDSLLSSSLMKERVSSASDLKASGGLAGSEALETPGDSEGAAEALDASARAAEAESETEFNRGLESELESEATLRSESTLNTEPESDRDLEADSAASPDSDSASDSSQGDSAEDGGGDGGGEGGVDAGGDASEDSSAVEEE